MQLAYFGVTRLIHRSHVAPLDVGTAAFAVISLTTSCFLLCKPESDKAITMFVDDAGYEQIEGLQIHRQQISGKRLGVWGKSQPDVCLACTAKAIFSSILGAIHLASWHLKQFAPIPICGFGVVLLWQSQAVQSAAASLVS